MPEINPVVLRNKGVPIELHKVRQDPTGRWELDWDGDDDTEPPRERVWVRFTANEVAEIEERFNGLSFVVTEPAYETRVETGDDGQPVSRRVPTGETRQVMRTFNGLEGFEKAGEYKPIWTNREALSIVLRRPPEQIGAAMIPEKTLEYQAAITGSWGIANGTPPETVGKALETMRVVGARRREQAVAEAEAALVRADEALATLDDTPGQTSSPSGSESPDIKEEASADPSTSSGA